MIVPKGKKNGSVVLVEITGEQTNTIERLISEGKEKVYGNTWLIDEEITDQIACLFDKRTKMYTDNRVYVGKKGAYVKKGGRKYYLGDFV